MLRSSLSSALVSTHDIFMPCIMTATRSRRNGYNRLSPKFETPTCWSIRPSASSSRATCGNTTPIQSLEHYWSREVKSRRFALFSNEQDFEDNILIRVSCDAEGSPLEVRDPPGLFLLALGLRNNILVPLVGKARSVGTTR